MGGVGPTGGLGDVGFGPPGGLGGIGPGGGGADGPGGEVLPFAVFACATLVFFSCL